MLFIKNYRIPKVDSLTKILEFFCENISNISTIPIINKPHCLENRCHDNVDMYVRLYGGEKILGYYFIENTSDKKIVAIKHSIWKNSYNKLIDITPFTDGRKYNIFLSYNKAKEKYIIV